MSLQPTVAEQAMLADTFRQGESGITARERLSEMVVVLGFLVAVLALWLDRPPGPFALVPAAVCMVVLAFATRVQFDTPLGFTVPTQLAFVPLVFAVPAPILPVAVVAALALSRLPDVVAGRYTASRLLMTVGNAWFAVGPATVFVLADVQPNKASAGILVAALASQILVDFVVSTARYALQRGASFAAQLRDAWVYGIDAALSPIALLVAEQLHRTPVAVLVPLPLLGVLGMFAHERHGRLESMLELNNAYRGTALVLGDVVEADDGYTGIHCKSVVALALAVAEQLGLGAEERRNLEFGALLHDVGKIAIPKEIINKPGKLDPDEWQTIKTHTTEGQKMLDQVGGFMREVGLIVRSHHERWDGCGYPDGLAGDAIPLEARIISCCDTWNAMRTDRAYRKALSPEIALAELQANAGQQFDPKIVDAVVQIVSTEVQEHLNAQEHRLGKDIVRSSAVARPRPSTARAH